MITNPLIQSIAVIIMLTGGFYCYWTVEPHLVWFFLWLMVGETVGFIANSIWHARRQGGKG